jgi:hypothetical protein
MQSEESDPISVPFFIRITCNRVVIEKLIVTQVVKIFSAFSGIQNSAPCSQQTITELRLDPVDFSPQHHILFI